MIYAGLIHFNEISPDFAHNLRSVLVSYTETPPTLIQKNSLTLCYGKLSEIQDMDKVWENASSLLIGRVFDKETHSSLEKKDFEALAHLDKKKSLEKLWGKYIYIGANQKNSSFDIVIDSTGQLPFFYYVFPNGNVLFSSDIEIIFRILGQKSEYNWTYLCSYLIYGNSCAIETPFKDIHELPPGCCLQITKNKKITKPFWDPLRSYHSSSYPERDAVSTLQSTLKPWIEPYANICVSLSGGLDSSALVYCLKEIVQDNQTLMALNYFHSQVKSSNELAHAQKVCEETGIKLIEIDASSCLPFDIADSKKRLSPSKPIPGLISLKWIDNTTQYLPSDRSCAFLSGHGSDHIFMRPPSKRSISDYILEKGFRGSKKPINDMTTFYRDTLFSILKENIVSLGAYQLGWRFNKRHPKNIQDERPQWMRQEIREKASVDFVHPIYNAFPKKILPGKYEQIDALYEGLASIHMEVNPITPTYYPYLYEPVLEFALSFPIYTLFNQGYDRYPLRKSVSDRFKTETVWRRDKSQTTGIFQLGMKKNLDYILDLCGEGEFVKQGLIDKSGLEDTIRLISNGDINYMWPFTHLASAEMFLRYWK